MLGLGPRRHAPSDRAARNRRRQHHDRRRLRASGRRVRSEPVHHRAREADRPDLEARAFRGRQTSGSKGRCRIRTTSAQRGGAAAGMRVRIRLFARLREIAGAEELEREVPAGSTLSGERLQGVVEDRDDRLERFRGAAGEPGVLTIRRPPADADDRPAESAIGVFARPSARIASARPGPRSRSPRASPGASRRAASGPCRRS